MAALPKIVYNNQKVNNIVLDSQPVYYIKDQNGTVLFHQHYGNKSTGGGCYTKSTYHKHTNSCYRIDRNTYRCGGWLDHESGGWYYCGKCGQGLSVWNGDHTVTRETKTLICGKTEKTVDTWELNCGYDPT